MSCVSDCPRTAGDADKTHNAGDPTKDGHQNADEEVGAATTLKEDTERGKDEGEDDLADVAGGRD